MIGDAGITEYFVWLIYRDRDFIDPWAPNQGPLGGSLNSFGAPLSGNGGAFGGNNFGGGGGGGNLPNQNQFGNNGFNNPNLNGLSGNNGAGNLPQLGGVGQSGGSLDFGQGNNSYGNNLGGGNNANGPIFGLNNNSGSNNGPNSDGKETTQVTIPKDVSFHSFV